MIKSKLILIFLIVSSNISLYGQISIVPYVGISHNEIAIDRGLEIIDSAHTNFNPIVGIGIQYEIERFKISLNNGYSKAKDNIRVIPVFDPDLGYQYSFWLSSLSAEYSPFPNLFLGLGFSRNTIFNYGIIGLDESVSSSKGFKIYSTTLNLSYHLSKIQLGLNYSSEFLNSTAENVFPKFSPMNPVTLSIGYRISVLKSKD